MSTPSTPEPQAPVAMPGPPATAEANSEASVLGLRHGRAYSTDAGRLAVTFVSNPERDGQPVRVNLVLVPDDGAEHEVALGVGDRFRLGPQEWALTGVDNLGTYDYVVNLARVAG
jgi:hypothetical protein